MTNVYQAVEKSPLAALLQKAQILTRSAMPNAFSYASALVEFAGKQIDNVGASCSPKGPETGRVRIAFFAPSTVVFEQPATKDFLNIQPRQVKKTGRVID